MSGQQQHVLWLKVAVNHPTIEIGERRRDVGQDGDGFLETERAAGSSQVIT